MMVGLQLAEGEGTGILSKRHVTTGRHDVAIAKQLCPISFHHFYFPLEKKMDLSKVLKDYSSENNPKMKTCISL